MLYKEGTGGDYGNVAANMEGEATPSAGTEFIPGSQLGVGAAPAGIVGPVVITQQPVDVATVENAAVTFSVGAMNANGAPICYQWQRDGTDIPGAIGASYTITPTLADSGAKFSVIASVLGADATSTEATLTVTVDNVAPRVVGVFSSLDGTNVTVRFNERVNATTAADNLNYSIPGNNVSSAILRANQTEVLLGLETAMAVGSQHQLSIQFVDDLAGNVMVATQVVVRAHVVTFGVARYDIYQGLPANTVVLSDLTGSPNYPHSPSLTRFKNILELNTADEFEGYGTRLTGFIVPPVNGDYVFYFHSDDNGQFSLSTDANPLNARVICNEPVWSGRRTWTGEAGGLGRVNVPSASGGPQANISGSIALLAGQMYYFEGLMKEGGGGDNMGVDWKIPGGPEPVNGMPSSIPAHCLMSLADPVGQAANVAGPRITASVSGNQITFSWKGAGFRLQRKSSVGTAGGWTDVPNGATSPVSVTIGVGNEFFRLTN